MNNLYEYEINLTINKIKFHKKKTKNKKRLERTIFDTLNFK